MQNSEFKKDDAYFMKEALKEALIALEKDEVPVGAVIVYRNKIIAKAHNQIRALKDPTAHAEIIAVTQAADFLGNEHLLDCRIYVTIEPCSMCAGALVLARVERIIYGADDPKTGACGSVLNIAKHRKLNHQIKLKRGVLKQECSRIIQDFFRSKRRLKEIISN